MMELKQILLDIAVAIVDTPEEVTVVSEEDGDTVNLTLSVAPDDNERNIHELLMGGNVAVIENAVLDGVEDGDYLLFAFPVKYGGCDGAPVRAVLIAE